MKLITLFAGILFFSSVSFAQCEDFGADLIVNNPTCYGFSDGSVTFIVSGGTEPYDISLFDSEGNEHGGFGGYTLLEAAWYYYTIIDSDGCIFEDSVELTGPGPLTVDLSIDMPSSAEACDGLAVADTVYNYNGEYETISYFWSPGGPSGVGENVFADVCVGDYTVTINDEFGCSSVTDFHMGFVGIQSHEMQDQIQVSSNQNGIVVQKEGSEKVFLTVYNSAGQLLFTSTISNNYTVIDHKFDTNYLIYKLENAAGQVKSGVVVR